MSWSADTARRISAVRERSARSLRTLATGVAPAMAPDHGAASFLAREARLLDERRWDDWLDLWAPGATYGMPTRRTTLPTDDSRAVDLELVPDGGVWWFDESREILEVRVRKLQTGKAWAEEPPSRTRRFVTNVEVERTGTGTALRVRSNLLVHRGRRDSEVEWFSCGRTDGLVWTDGQLSLVSRRVVLDANVLPADNLVLFF